MVLDKVQLSVDNGTMTKSFVEIGTLDLIYLNPGTELL